MSLFAQKGIKVFHVQPGLQCNLSCSHCANNSGPNEKLRLSPSELESIKAAIERFVPENLLFTGGEPTLHIPEINAVIAAHPKLHEAKVLLTTNGWFTKSDDDIAKTLGQFMQLDEVLLSYDRFHGSKVKHDDILRLKDYCSNNNQEFSVSVCISNPVELIWAQELKQKIQVPVIFQRVTASGRAKTNNKAFQYFHFEKEVLEKKCPNLGTISYICGKGFSVCCSSLIFNSNMRDIYHDTVEGHMESPFYQKISKNNFGELLAGKEMSLTVLEPKHSDPCSLCELVNADELRLPVL